jgi:predicted phosphodiesterase
VTYAVISDIHSNFEALEAVLGEIATLPVDAIWCLGDIVGYGADPDECTREVVARCGTIVRGNHDKAVVGLIGLDWFNSTARRAALWNREHSSEETLAALRGLPRGPIEMEEGAALCHGTPVDEDEYMLSADAVERSFRWIDGRKSGIIACFHGHSHLPLVIERPGGGKKQAKVLRDGNEVHLEPKSVYLINPGSVGQPRDGNPRASFGIFDSKSLVYRNLRVTYNMKETQRKIRAAGLPIELALRLAEGR